MMYSNKGSPASRYTVYLNHENYFLFISATHTHKLTEPVRRPVREFNLRLSSCLQCCRSRGFTNGPV